eukprot:XP_016658170.1 PREDICTED: uncharacterized protein LOC107883156 isoform X2 [Acyrthosiphon pisum]
MYLPVKWMSSPYLKEKLYYTVRIEEDILVKLIKAMYATVKLQGENFDNHRCDAGVRDFDIGNSGNGGTNGNGGYNSGAVAHGPSGNEGARGPAGGREWTNHVGVHRTLGYESQDENAAKP